MNRFRNIIILLLLLPQSVLAEGADHMYGFYWQIADLCIFITVLAIANKYAGNPLKQFWQGRWKKIEDSCRVSEKLLEEAEMNLKTARTKLNNIENAVAEMYERIEKETQDESYHILKSAQMKADGIKAQAKVLTELERSNSEQIVKNELVNDVVKGALSKMKSENSYEKDKARRFATMEMLKSWKNSKGCSELRN